MAKNIYGGGANTNLFGLQFEQTTSLATALLNAGYEVRDYTVFKQGEAVAILGSKHDFIRNILNPLRIDTGILSKKLLPDDAIVNFKNSTVYILEKKFQHGSGSVDEKLQTCDFKKKQYQKLFQRHNVKVEYCYICNDWFKQAAYKDVIDYIHSVGYQIFFNEIPLEFLGL